jgi:alpha-mannosidase
MKNYLDRMYESIVDLDALQQKSIEVLIQPNFDNFKNGFLTNNFIRGNAEEVPARLIINFDKVHDAEIVLFNSLAQDRIEIVTLRVSTPNIYVLNSEENQVRHQINHVFKRKENHIEKSSEEFELIFMVKLDALSLSTYKIIYDENSNSISSFEVKKAPKIDNFEIESATLKLKFDGKTGFLTKMFKDLIEMPVYVNFGAYRTSISNSGAYLFKPNETSPEMNIFENDQLTSVITMKGSIASYAIITYGSLLISSFRILDTNTHLDNDIFMENTISFEKRHTNAEMFMRIQTNVKNDITFHTDLNNFQWVKRKRVSSIGVDGNYYPITSSVFIQDDYMRASLITNHAQGATSPKEGIIEVMLERRTPTDDHRGLDEGVTDNLSTKQSYWVSFENFNENKLNSKVIYTPSIHVHHLINILSYPVNSFLIDNKEKIQLKRRVNLLKQPLPCDMHLFNLRTVSSSESKPSQSSLLILRRYNFDCFLISSQDPFYVKYCTKSADSFENIQLFNDLKIDKVVQTSLTAIKSMGEITKFNKNMIDVMELKTFKINFSFEM